MENITKLVEERKRVKYSKFKVNSVVFVVVVVC